ncbi:MAG: phosphatase PAP2 family protein [Chthoniobacterales bacterium]
MPNDIKPPKPIPRARIIWLAILAILLSGASFFADAPVRAAILDHQGKGWKKTSEYAFQAAISKNGDWPQLMIAGLIGLAIAGACKRKDWQKVIVAALIASTLAGMLANASRLTTGRTRPRESPKIEAGWYGPFHNGEILIGNSKYNAFPSGHTATAVGFAAPFLFAKPIAGAGLMVLALMVAWSRMALGAHNLSDVIVSTLLALAVGWFVYRRINSHSAAYRSRIVNTYQSWKRRRKS